MKKHRRKIKLILASIVVTLLASFYAIGSVIAAPANNPHSVALLNIAQLKNPPAVGNGINLGGFSALTHVSGDPSNVFYF